MLRVPRVTVPRALCRARRYHDDASFGYRVPSKYELPDCECPRHPLQVGATGLES